jgi:NAD(P)-dependent dehydrogenase (short-subunit alcohol dehydrogenase family)
MFTLEVEMNFWKDSVVVVTGASAGVGRATVRLLGSQGARIGLIARGKEGLEAAKRDVEEAGGEAMVIQADVSDPARVEYAASLVEDHFGPIDVWINDAMVSVFSPFHLMTPEEFRRVTEVTYLGYVYGTMSALNRMRKRDRGTIVQVGSALAYRAIPLQSAYCGAKHAIEGFTESIRCELRHDQSNVKITMVQLPAVNTPQFSWVKSRLPRKPQPVPPIFQPEVAARAIVWAAEHTPREIDVTLRNKILLVGNDMFPTLGDIYLAKTGYDSQQTSEPEDPDRHNNLWEPVSGDHGAHGDFDEKARNQSPYLWATKHRKTIGASLALLGLSLLAKKGF